MLSLERRGGAVRARRKVQLKGQSHFTVEHYLEDCVYGTANCMSIVLLRTLRGGEV